MSYYTDGGTELPDKDEIAKLIRTLSLGEVDKVAEKIAEMIEDAYRQGTYDGEGNAWR